jgi:hypothetical protein
MCAGAKSVSVGQRMLLNTSPELPNGLGRARHDVFLLSALWEFAGTIFFHLIADS